MSRVRNRLLLEARPPRVSEPQTQTALDQIFAPLRAVIRYCQNRVLVDVDFTTADVLETGYPVQVSVDLERIVGVSVVKVLDVADPNAVRYEAVDAAAWTSKGGDLSIHYFTGLEPLTAYTITLEVIGA